jgi:hypothetical protein
MAPDPTSGVSRGPCKPDFFFGLFHYLNWTLNLTADFSVYLIWTHWFWLLIFTWWRSRPVGRGNYFTMAPDPTFDIFRGPYSPILWFVFPIGLMKLITVRYFCHFKIFIFWKSLSIASAYNEFRLKLYFRKIYGRYNDLACKYNLSLIYMLNNLFHIHC